ncbi:hypothetical protein EV666_11147 [Camelimonas lactis]|uniref:Uncharacterized protein n=1 Tax=Camelimonas lactis TaxID=659006 RepID=A0A4R2GQJ8_9HYPH|nr:hypothetical protein EV666_11147 [Camelimonas lactis]
MAPMDVETGGGHVIAHRLTGTPARARLKPGVDGRARPRPTTTTHGPAPGPAPMVRRLRIRPT